MTTPSTLGEWRAYDLNPEIIPRDVWTPLEQFFHDKGYTLWRPRFPDDSNSIAPNDFPRTPDGFAYSTKYTEQQEGPYSYQTGIFCHNKSIHCPARTTDNRDVLIRLIDTIHDGTGKGHHQALRRLAMGAIGSRGDNHVVPVLQEIIHDGMVFAVFPLMSARFDRPWYYEFREVLDAVEQVLEGVDFCHERLVAHRDLDNDNILVNHDGGPFRVFDPSDPEKLSPFRSYFPVRYYLNDFEFAVSFDPSSELSSRLVKGFPTDDIRKGREYGRVPAPEMLSENPYCPFRADIWQLGAMFTRLFGHLDTFSTTLGELFSDMSSQDPLARPKSFQALSRAREIRATVSHQILSSRVPPPADD